MKIVTVDHYNYIYTDEPSKEVVLLVIDNICAIRYLPATKKFPTYWEISFGSNDRITVDDKTFGMIERMLR